jgi:peptide/nickel transport system substrate-binding protein
MVNQEMYMQAVVGANPDLYKVCAAFFVCDTPLASDLGAERVMEFSIDKAKKLLKESGYNGEKVVLMHPTDTANLNALSLVSAQLLRDMGVNLEVQAMDWSTLTSRRAIKEPLDKGGWNLFHTTWIGPDVMNPAVNIGVSGGCAEKAWFGWPCDEKIEELRGTYAKTGDPAEQKKIAGLVQARANEVVTYIPLGQFFTNRAYRKNVHGYIDSPVAFFWNMEKKG